MSSVFTMPDSEALAIKIIRDKNITVDGRPLWVGATFPGKEHLPVGLVQRWGGNPVMKEWVDRPRLQLEAWASHKVFAYQAIDAMRVALLEAQGTTKNYGGGDTRNAVIAGVYIDLGITWQPDTVTHVDRYILGMAMVLHPIPV